ncbi:LysR family transcriptional regulator [Bradyrhizobium sp. CCBAU 25338]|uniref:LysR family transcriptional regulator n=1 Tax=Bradyrhizobium sp. CCBAU 25338 TaxID=1641877 RepID=UPI002304B698|nr:LysR family transcriptional regulator [Bradyrhizobium sp. CCBAU 25338]
MFEYRQVLYFRAVASCGSISAAAAKLHIAQPALSAQIMSLEQKLGQPLFSRHARGVSLTPHGEVFSVHADLIVARFEAAEHAVKTLNQEIGGPVTIGLPITVANVLTGPILAAVNSQHPNIELAIVEALSGEIARWHVDGRFDLSVLYRFTPAYDEEVVPLVVEDLWAFGRKSTLEQFGAEIPLDELESLAIYHTSPSHVCREALMSAASSKRVQLRVVAEVDSIVRLNEMALGSNGITVFPLASIPPSALATGHACRIVSPDIALATTIETSPKRSPTRATEAVLHLIRGVAHEALANGRWVGARAA